MRADIEITCKGLNAQPVNPYEFILEISGVDIDELIDAAVTAAGPDAIFDRMNQKEVLDWVQGLGYTLSTSD